MTRVVGGGACSRRGFLPASWQPFFLYDVWCGLVMFTLCFSSSLRPLFIPSRVWLDWAGQGWTVRSQSTVRGCLGEKMHLLSSKFLEILTIPTENGSKWPLPGYVYSYWFVNWTGGFLSMDIHFSVILLACNLKSSDLFLMLKHEGSDVDYQHR